MDYEGILLQLGENVTDDGELKEDCIEPRSNRALTGPLEKNFTRGYNDQCKSPQLLRPSRNFYSLFV